MDLKKLHHFATETAHKDPMYWHATVSMVTLGRIAEMLGPKPSQGPEAKENGKVWEEMHAIRAYINDKLAWYEATKYTPKKSTLLDPFLTPVDDKSLLVFGGVKLTYQQCLLLTGLKKIEEVEYQPKTMGWLFFGKKSLEGPDAEVYVDSKEMTFFLEYLNIEGYGGAPKLPTIQVGATKVSPEFLADFLHVEKVLSTDFCLTTMTWKFTCRRLFKHGGGIEVFAVTQEALEEYVYSVKGLHPAKLAPVKLGSAAQISPGGIPAPKPPDLPTPGQYLTLMMDWSALSGASAAEVHKTLIALVSKIGNNKAALIHALAAEETSASCIVTVTGLETVKDQITALENLGVTFKV